MKKLIFRNKKGVTMIELIVSISIFSIAIISVLSILSISITAQRKVLALQDVEDNARFILEFMAKEVRMGIINGAGTDYLNITRSDGDVVQYSFSEGNMIRANISDNESGAINSDNINITGSFYTSGIGVVDNLEPKVTIALSIQGQGSKAEEQARIDIQTTLSQRTLDMP